MKRAWVGMCLLVLLAAVPSWAEGRDTTQVAPSLLANARYVYVTSYDGDEYSPDISMADRDAIGNVREAIAAWGHYVNVYDPANADIILVVESHASEDVLAAYDPQFDLDLPLWRAMERGGLQPGETPLVARLRKAVERSASRQGTALRRR